MDIYQTVTGFYRAHAGEKRIIGGSYLGRNLYAVRLGEGRPVGIATYAIHGREWITAKLALAQSCGAIWGSVWLLPLLNPDGALLSQVGIKSAVGSEYHAWLSGFTGEELSLWKANARGVDLNVNFAAKWGTGEANVWHPCAENFVGECAFSEKETKALRDFTLEIRPDYTMSYHTKGEEIYWHFGQTPCMRLRDFRIAKALSSVIGYPLKEVRGSAGGYKDWCISALKIPSITIEVGEEKWPHPLDERALNKILKENAMALDVVARAVQKENNRYGKV